jgi:hypothetical protein
VDNFVDIQKRGGLRIHQADTEFRWCVNGRLVQLRALESAKKRNQNNVRYIYRFYAVRFE